MSEQLQNYNLWENDYYSSGEMGMVSQGFFETNDFSTNLYAKNTPINPHDHHRNFPINADVIARNACVVSSPETATPGASPGKAKRRRSKGGAAAAASQSTTFLNASISNFRALVQQHTGCHNTTTSSPKGPITLCFGTPSSTQEPHHQYYYA